MTHLRQATCLFAFMLMLACKPDGSNEFVCPPCEQACDEIAFNKSGPCPVCGMELVKMAGAHETDELNLPKGKGSFIFPVRTPEGEKETYVFYYRPKNFNPDSRLLIAIPGSGRDADEYRDAWIPFAEQYDVMILSPMYPESAFGFEAYHFGGLVRNMNLMQAFTRDDNSNRVQLDEAALQFEPDFVPDHWIFDDFDLLFEAVVEATGSRAQTYDLFGHSAGAQILHRLVLFYPESKADRIVAANAGFYTLPDPGSQLLFGIKGFPLQAAGLEASFKKNLIVLLGEEDNGSETRGTLLISPSASRQGNHRLARGRYFYNYSQTKADSLEMSFGWKLREVPGVGHDFKKMTAAAAAYLYAMQIPVGERSR